MIRSPHNTVIMHKSLVQDVVEYIESLILSGELSPGERLIEQVMCDRFQVSRSPLREAFRILENQGFLVNKARKGVFVREVSKKEAIDIYVIRANLESLATLLAVQKDDGSLAVNLKEMHRQMLCCAEEGDSWKYTELNREFHEVLISSCGNERLIEMLRVFSKQTFRYRSEVMRVPGKMEESLRKHEMLIESIERGDAVEAERLCKEAILANTALLEKVFSSGENRV